MIKVITYGTYDLLHYGHIKLLERAKSLGDYLIVGVTADDFDKTRGKINVQQSLMERVEAVRSTGIADEIIIEEYEGQKIDDIQKYDIVQLTNNKLLDLLLSKYSALCNNNNIKLNIEVRTANLDHISDTDLSMIINNLMDNAFESAKKSKEKVKEKTDSQSRIPEKNHENKVIIR